MYIHHCKTNISPKVNTTIDIHFKITSSIIPRANKLIGNKMAPVIIAVLMDARLLKT